MDCTASISDATVQGHGDWCSVNASEFQGLRNFLCVVLPGPQCAEVKEMLHSEHLAPPEQAHFVLVSRWGWGWVLILQGVRATWYDFQTLVGPRNNLELTPLSIP